MLIGMCGFQSCGKDTVADLLIREYGFKKLNFSGALKDIISIIFGWSRTKLEGLTKEDREWREQVDQWWATELNIPQLTPRYVLQYFGTELFRNHWHQDIWVKIMENKLNQLKTENIVVTDCRFENEFALLTKYGGKIIHVYRMLPNWFESYKTNKDNPVEITSMHRSELEWIKCEFDYELSNEKTIEELYEKIRIIIKTT
jgi:hypothetical protein